MEQYGRRDVLTVLGLGGIGALLPSPVHGAEAAHRPETRPPLPARPGFRHDLERAQAVVGASHSNFDRVRELVLEQPALAKASWDWGFGDWETALGAASHTGRRQIAEFLIAHGARPTLFSAAMLGEVDVVRAHVEARPETGRIHGPHGISLLRHARAGGDEAAPVVDYLLDRLGPDEAEFGIPADEAMAERYAGRYVDPDTPDVTLTVAADRWLTIGGGEQAYSRVLRVSDEVFHPTGAPSVRVSFDIVGGRAREVTVEDGPDRWTLQRS